MRTHPQFRRSELIVVTSLDEDQRAPYAFALEGVPVVHKPRLVAELPALLTPVLLLWGADDLAYPPATTAQRFASDLPDARLVVLPATGHYPQEERPERVVEELRRFFAEQEGATR